MSEEKKQKIKEYQKTYWRLKGLNIKINKTALEVNAAIYAN